MGVAPVARDRVPSGLHPEAGGRARAINLWALKQGKLAFNFSKCYASLTSGRVEVSYRKLLVLKNLAALLINHQRDV